MLILVTGVSGSGKSEYAEKICCDLADGEKKYYIATMQPFGAEGRSVSAVIMRCGRAKGLKPLSSISTLIKHL